VVPAAPPDEETTVGARLALARGQLMGGHGPGAAPALIAGHTRDRVPADGGPVSAHLERTAQQAGRARQDPNASAAMIVAQCAELTGTLDALAERLRPTRMLRRGVDQVPASVTVASWLLAALTLVAAARWCYQSAAASTAPNAVTPAVSHAT